MSLEAFNKRVLPAKNKLFRFALRLLGSEEEAKDIVQETMIKVWNKRDEMHNYLNMEAWCMRVVRNMSYDLLKSKHKQTLGFSEGFDVKADIATPYRAAEVSNTMETIHQLIESLPDKQKQVIQLRDIEGYSYKEIADILEIDVNNVKINLFRGRKSVRERLLNINAYGVR